MNLQINIIKDCPEAKLLWCIVPRFYKVGYAQCVMRVRFLPLCNEERDECA